VGAQGTSSVDYAGVLGTNTIFFCVEKKYVLVGIYLVFVVSLGI
jgi:hypothetical protein